LIVAKGAVRATAGREQIDLKNGTEMRVERVHDDGRIDAMVRVGKEDRRVTIDAVNGARIDLAYAQTANAAQGRTVDVALGYMRSTQRKLADQQRLYVILSRARDRAVIFTDGKVKLAERIAGNTGRKETALDREPEPSNGQQRGAPEREAETKHRVGDALRAVGRKAGAAARAADRAMQRHGAQAGLRKYDRSTKRALKHVNAGLKAAVRHAAYEHDHRAAVRARAHAADAKVRIKGQQVVTHASFEAREAGKATTWVDPKAGKQLARMANGRTARSTDRGKTWREERGVRGLIDRHQGKAQAKRTARIEDAHRRWQESGGRETTDSRQLATRALETYQSALVTRGKPKNWDRLADKHGIEYDSQGHRYARDDKGHVYSETLTKRHVALENTAHGRHVRFETAGHTSGAIRGLYARHQVESAIRDGKEREILRLIDMAGESRAVARVLGVRRKLGTLREELRHQPDRQPSPVPAPERRRHTRPSRDRGPTLL
jgi:hypothetical protein